MSFDGTWNITTQSPMGAQQGTLTLASEGTSLTGTMAGPQGDIAITDGVVDGQTATWKAEMTAPMPMTLEFAGTVEGDTISGDVKLGAFGSASFSGTRV